MTETENTQQPKKAGYNWKAFIIYLVVIWVFLYAYNYWVGYRNYSSWAKTIEPIMNIPVTEEALPVDTSVQAVDLGTFQMAIPQDRLQLISFTPGSNFLWIVLDNMSIQFTQPATAAMIAEAIKKVQELNSDNDAIKHMTVNSFDWCKQAAQIDKLSFLALNGLNEIDRKKYDSQVRYKASVVNGRGIAVFSTNELNGILHCGTEQPEGEEKLLTAIVELWDKQRDIHQKITMQCQVDKYDTAMADLKKMVASISYNGKEIVEPDKQVLTCFEAVKSMPKFALIKINQENKTQPNQNVQPAPAGEAAPAQQEQEQN